MDVVLALFLILLLSVALAKSTGFVVLNVIKLAKCFSVPEFAIGFFVLGFATSLPEIFVAVNSVIDKTPQLSLGNLLGAIFVLLTLVISLPAIFTGNVAIRKVLSTKDIVLSSFVTALPAFFSLDGNLTRVDGAVLLIFYVVYMYMLNEDESFIEKIKSSGHSKKGALKLLLFVLVGMFGIFVFSKGVVELSLILAEELLVPVILAGVLFLSIGTNLPEFSLAIKTITSKHKIVGIGDFLGSASMNTFVLALLCLVSPFKVTNLEETRIISFFVIFAVILLAVFMRTKRQLTRKEGFTLLSLYLIFIFVELYRNGVFSKVL